MNGPISAAALYWTFCAASVSKLQSSCGIGSRSALANEAGIVEGASDVQPVQVGALDAIHIASAPRVA